MVRILRLFLGLSATAGIVVSVLLYLASFRGHTVDTLWACIAVLIVGAVASSAMVYIVEYPESKARHFFINGFAKGMPKWTAALVSFFWLLFATHLGLFAMKSGLAYPALRNGQYALVDRGQIVRIIT